MKRIIIPALLMLSVSFFLTPHASCQEVKKEKTTKETDKEYQDNENEDGDDNADVPKKQSHTKKVSHHVVHQHANFGLEGGLNMANMKMSWPGSSYTNKAYTGGRFGMIIDIPASSNFFIQPGLFYVRNGTKLSTSDYYDTYSETIGVNTFEVPVNLLYKFGKPGTSRIFISAGCYAGYNVSGIITNHSSGYKNTTLDIGNNDTDAIKAIDFGLSAGIGYELGKGWLFRARYQRGLVNLSPSNNGGNITTSSFGIQIGYIFGRKSAHKVKRQKDDDYIEPKMQR